MRIEKINSTNSTIKILITDDELCLILNIMGGLLYGVGISDKEANDHIGFDSRAIKDTSSEVRKIMNKYDIDL